MHSAAMLTLGCIDYIETPFFTAILDSAYYLLVPSALPRRIHRLVPFPPRPSHPPSLHLVLPSRDIDLHSVHSIIILLLLSLHDREPQPSPELIPYSIRSFHRHRHRRTTPARATLHIQPTPDELRPDTRHLSAPSGLPRAARDARSYPSGIFPDHLPSPLRPSSNRRYNPLSPSLQLPFSLPWSARPREGMRACSATLAGPRLPLPTSISI